MRNVIKIELSDIFKKLRIYTKNDAVFYILLVLSVFLLYSVSLQYHFLEGWDDQIYVSKNPYIAFNLKNFLYWFTHAPPVGGYTPLTMFSFIVDHLLWGFNTIGYRLQNILWHTAAVLIVFKIFRSFNIKSALAFMLCMIFALHPQRVESVVWISERKDVLSAFFYFAAIYLNITNNVRGNSRVPIFICFILSLLAKPMAYSLPFVLILCDIHFEKHIDLKKIILKFWLYFLILLPYAVITVATQSHGIVPDNFGVFQRIYIVLYNFFWYLKSTFIPFNVLPVYPRISFSNSVVWLFCAYLVIIALGYALFLKQRKFAFDALLIVLGYIVSLIPVCGIFLLGVFDHADRFSYIPSFFIWLGVGLLISVILDTIRNRIWWKRTVYLFIFLYMLSVTFITYFYIGNWESLYTMNKAACNTAVPNPVVLQKLGDMELYFGNYIEALAVADKLVNTSDFDNLTDRERRSNIIAGGYIKCFAYYHLGEKPKTIFIFEKMEEYLIPENLPSSVHYINLLSIIADSYYSVGQKKKAIDICGALVLFCKGNKGRYYFYKGVREFYRGDFSQALFYFNNSLKFNPADKDLQKNINICKKMLNIQERK